MSRCGVVSLITTPLPQHTLQQATARCHGTCCPYKNPCLLPRIPAAQAAGAEGPDEPR